MIHACILSGFSMVCGPYGARLLCPWDSPDQKPGAACHALLQGISPTRGLNPCLLHLLHWQVASLPLAPSGKPIAHLIILKEESISVPASCEDRNEKYQQSFCCWAAREETVLWVTLVKGQCAVGTVWLLSPLKFLLLILICFLSHICSNFQDKISATLISCNVE